MFQPARHTEPADVKPTARRFRSFSDASPPSAAALWGGRDVPSPRASSSAPAAALRAEPLPTPRGEPRATASSVLVVDDNIKVRLDLRAALHAAGFTVTACDSRASAMKALQSRSFSLLILDVILQDGTGIELLRALRSRQETADVPVILLASGSGMKDRLRGLDLGVDEVLLKPFVAAELVRCALRMARFSSGAEPSSMRDESPRARDVSPLSAGAVWRNQSEVPVGSLLYRAALQSGLATVLGPVTVARACKRAGVESGVSSPLALAAALPAIRDTLRLFLSKEDLEPLVAKLAATLRSLPVS